MMLMEKGVSFSDAENGECETVDSPGKGEHCESSGGKDKNNVKMVTVLVKVKLVIILVERIKIGVFAP